MDRATQEIEVLCETAKWSVILRSRTYGYAGPEALYVLDADAKAVKTAMIRLEGSYPWGRLWDLDVIAANGERLTRRRLGLLPRSCLLCSRPAHECSRSRRHPIDQLLKAIANKVEELDRTPTACEFSS